VHLETKQLTFSKMHVSFSQTTQTSVLSGKLSVVVVDCKKITLYILMSMHNFGDSYILGLLYEYNKKKLL